MKGKNLALLIIVAAGLAAWAAWSSKTSRRSAPDLIGKRVLPNLPINDVRTIQVTTPQEKLTITKSNDTWIVKNTYGYPADLPKVKGALIKLSEMKIGQVMRVSQKQKEALKMVPPDAGVTNTAGTLVELFAANDKKAASLLVGDVRQRKSPARDGFEAYGGYPDGQYVSPDGGKNVFLVKDLFEDLSPRIQDWLDLELLSIEPSELSAITIASADGKELKLSRTDAAGTLELDPDLGRFHAGPGMHRIAQGA